MKKFFHITIWTILLIAIPACHRHTEYPFTMRQAEALMNIHPDSSLHLLQGMEDSLAMLPHEAQMYYQLLTIQAKDKLYITHTDDSLINRIVVFYEKQGNKDRLMMAYYYQGSIYRDMNDAPRALKAFQQAVNLNARNLDLLAKTYNQMGTLFMYQGLYDEAIRVNKKSIEAYLLQGKQNKISYAQRDIARMYDVKNMPDSALHYYQNACQTALTDGDSVRYYGILGELGGFHYEAGNLDTSKRILLFLKDLTFIDDKTHIYSILGNIYKNEDIYDSASYYFNKAADNGNLYHRYNKYKHLFTQSSNTGNYSEAVNYIKKALVLKDSIDNITQTEAIAKINALYNYQHIATKHTQLRLNQEKQKSILYILLFILLLTILISIHAVTFYRLKKIQATNELKKKEQLKAKEYEKSQKALEDNKQKISELNKMLKEAKTEQDILKQEILQVQRKRIEAKNEEIIQQQREKELLITEFKQSDLYKEFWLSSINEDSDKHLTQNPGKWIALQQYIDKIYPLFTENIKEIIPSISYTELQVCWLTKAGISPSGISRILNLTKQAITNIRSRLTKKLKLKDCQWRNFDHFIEEL